MWQRIRNHGGAKEMSTRDVIIGVVFIVAFMGFVSVCYVLQRDKDRRREKRKAKDGVRDYSD